MPCVASTPVRAPEAEALVRGQRLTPEIAREAGVLAQRVTDPVSDGRGSADYKRAMAGVFVRRALEQAWQRVGSGLNGANHSLSRFTSFQSGEVWGEGGGPFGDTFLIPSLFQRESGSYHARVGERLMTFTQSCTIAASREAVWDFLMDMQNIAQCLPGVEDVRQVDAETYDGTLRIKMGPIALALQGTIYVEAKDREQWHGAMRAEAKDRRLGGGIRACMGMDLLQRARLKRDARHLETHVLGKIGEFGQPVMRKRADAMLQDFARQVSARLAGSGQ